MQLPINLRTWIESNRESLKPPVGNKLIWENSEFMAFVVGGPNTRTDYHKNPGEEFFYQLEGTMTLKIRENGKVEDIPIREGEIYLLPVGVPHSPRRPKGTVGLVIERKRLSHEIDELHWYCEKCDEPLYSESFHLKDIVRDLPPVFERFYSKKSNTVCSKCGTELKKP